MASSGGWAVGGLLALALEVLGFALVFNPRGIRTRYATSVVRQRQRLHVASRNARVSTYEKSMISVGVISMLLGLGLVLIVLTQ
jgi:hypothetical protein